jgi:hypothetical protein
LCILLIGIRHQQRAQFGGGMAHVCGLTVVHRTGFDREIPYHSTFELGRYDYNVITRCLA